MPLLLGGDLNQSPAESSILTLCDLLKLVRVSDDSPTTRSRAGGLSSNVLDHVIVNQKMLDLQAHAKVSRDEAISDRFPILGAFRVPRCDFNVTHWPRPPVIHSHPCAKIEWEGEMRTFVEWSHVVAKWIAKSFQVPVESKSTVHTTPYQEPKIREDKKYAAFRSAYRLVNHLMKHAQNPFAWTL